jgi:hypothetical protein
MKRAVTLKQSARQNALFLLKVVAEVIDPVMGSSQLGRIERQIRTIEATNIRVMNLLTGPLPIHRPTPGRRRGS